MSLNKWDYRFINLAHHISAWSKDRSTKVGAVIISDNRRIVSVGYNGFPRGVDDDLEERHERPAKYFYAEHAERNAIYNAHASVEGMTMYVVASRNLAPCADCARAIIQSGIKKIVCHEIEDNNWEDSNKAAFEMFREAGIEIQTIPSINEPK